jgi:8-oxo-dGTP diphosphatase
MTLNGKTVRLGAGVIMYNDDSEVMIQLRDDAPGKKYPYCWVLFGGGIEDHELPIDAALREIYEETGLELDGLEFFKVYLYEDEDEIHHQYIFKCRIDKSLRTLDITEGAGYRLIRKEDVAGLKFGFNIRQVIEDFFEEKYGQVEKTDKYV